MTNAGLATPEIQAQLIAEALLSADVGFLVWDEDRTYIAANACACEILGTTLEELLGQPVGGHTVGGDALVEQAVREESTWGEADVERFDGGGAVRVRYATFATRSAGMPFMATVIRRL
ncbi:MAG TPA: PAS domain-containing protein [Gaiellaceae bacterium]